MIVYKEEFQWRDDSKVLWMKDLTNQLHWLRYQDSSILRYVRAVLVYQFDSWPNWDYSDRMLDETINLILTSIVKVILVQLSRRTSFPSLYWWTVTNLFEIVVSTDSILNEAADKPFTSIGRVNEFSRFFDIWQT